MLSLLRRLQLVRRNYRALGLSESRQQKTLREGISFADYQIINSEKNSMVHNLNPHVANMVTLHDFRRNVIDDHQMRQTRRFKNLRKGRTQSLFCLLLHSLHFTCLPRDKITGSIKYTSDALRNEIKNNTRSPMPLSELWSVMKSRDPNLEEKTKECISWYMYGDSKTGGGDISSSDVSLALAALLYHSPEMTYPTVLNCVSSVISTDVTGAYRSLEGIAAPLFIKRDIIGRSPKSDLELRIIYQLYEELNGTDTSFNLLKSLIHHTKLYDVKKLEELSRMIVAQEKLTDHEWNTLVLAIADNHHMINSKEYSLVLLRSQRILLDHMRQHGGKVMASGYLGMCLSLHKLSPSRSKQFYELSSVHLKTRGDHELYQRVSLRLSETPELLAENLNESLAGTSDEGALWNDFYQFAYDLDITIKNDAELMTSQMKSSIASKATLIDRMPLGRVINESRNLDNKSVSVLIRKLYQHSGPISNFPSGSHCARYIFRALSNPTRPIVGQMIYGESKSDPQGAFDRYRTFVGEFCGGFPNDKCLLSLLVPALAIQGLRWGDVPAVQIAVHEFRKFVNPVSTDHASLIPTIQLWRTYILVCGRFKLNDEISEIFDLWEMLRFVPDRKTLGMLLGAFPNRMGNRIREHGVEHLSPETYDEMSTDVWDWPSEKDINLWREQM